MDVAVNSRASSEALVRQRTVVVLRIGFRLAVVLLATGVAMAALRQEALPRELGNPVDIMEGLTDGDPGSVVGLGIVGIILTPLAATIAITLTYLQAGDRRYAAISGVILLILLISVSLSVV